MSNLNVNNITPLAGTTGTVSVSGSLFVSGNITANGNINLGNEDIDSVSFGAEISSSIIPDATNTYNLGSAAKQWNTIFANTISGTIETDYIQCINITASDNISSSNTVYAVTGSFDYLETDEWMAHTDDAQTGIQLGSDTVDILANTQIIVRVRTSAGSIFGYPSYKSTLRGNNVDITGSIVGISGSSVTGSLATTASFGEVDTENIYMNNGGSTGQAQISGAGDLVFAVGTDQDFRFTEGGTNFAFFDGSSRSFRLGSSGIGVPAAILEVAGDITTLGPSGSITASQAVSASTGVYGLNVFATGSEGTGSFNSITVGTYGNFAQVGQQSLYVTGSVGFGNLLSDGVSTLNVSGAISASTDLYIGAHIYHADDTDTYILFGDDYIDFRAGNARFMVLDENDGTQDIFQVNPQSADIDFSIHGDTVSDLVLVEANADKIHFNGVVTASNSVTALNIIATGSEGTGSFNSVEIGQHGTNSVTQTGQQSLYVTGSVSFGNETATDPLYTLNVSGGISASGALVVEGDATFGTDTVTINGDAGDIFASSIVSASGFHMPNPILASVDGTHFGFPVTYHASTTASHKFTIQGQMQAQVADGDSSGIFTVSHGRVKPYSVVVGNITGDNTLIGGLSMSTMQTRVTADHSMSFFFVDSEGGEVIADDTPFTASFVILGTSESA